MMNSSKLMALQRRTWSGERVRFVQDENCPEHTIFLHVHVGILLLASIVI